MYNNIIIPEGSELEIKKIKDYVSKTQLGKMKDEKQNDHITLACFLKQRYIAIIRLEERWMKNLVNCSIESHKNKNIAGQVLTYNSKNFH